jgi:hypothetical protein
MAVWTWRGLSKYTQEKKYHQTNEKISAALGVWITGCSGQSGQFMRIQAG